jgi:glycosyltransferase involved in cell wall biosynthesis
MINFFGIIHQSGGCGPELLGAIELLRSRNVPVRCIVPEDDPIVRSDRADFLRKLGCTVVNYRPGLFEKCNILMSFGEHKMFDYMREYSDRPKWVVWSSCMSHVVDVEVQAHKDGLIDEYFFQTEANGDLVGPALARAIGKGAKIAHRKNYRLYINPNSEYMPLIPLERSRDIFNVVRATRDDEEKWDEESWRMYGGVLCPSHRAVQVEVAGWGQNAADKVGNPCDPSSKWNGFLNVTLHPHIENPLEMAALYGRAHVLLHYYPFVESFGIATTQAMLCGAVPIGADSQGFREQIIHGETGFLCKTTDEAAYYASTLAFDDERWVKMSRAARESALGTTANQKHAWPWWDFLLKEKAMLSKA